jgi:hypothetical protein
VTQVTDTGYTISRLTATPLSSRAITRSPPSAVWNVASRLIVSFTGPNMIASASRAVVSPSVGFERSSSSVRWSIPAPSSVLVVGSGSLPNDRGTEAGAINAAPVSRKEIGSNGVSSSGVASPHP